MPDIIAKRRVAPHYKLTIEQIYDLSLDAMSEYEIKQIISGIDETLDEDEAYLDELFSEHDYAIEQRNEIADELNGMARKRADTAELAVAGEAAWTAEKDALLSEIQQIEADAAELAVAGEAAWTAAKEVGTVIREVQQISEEYRKAQDFLREYLRGNK